MNLRLIASSVLLVTLLATSAHAQNRPAPPPPPPPPPSAPPPPPAPPSASSPEATKRIHIVEKVAAAKLIHQVPPVYPDDARAANVSGTVVLHAIISKYGSVQKLDVVSGPPMLVKAATDAVKQWTYRPTLVDGDVVEVDTTVTVVFTLQNPPKTKPAP